MLEIVFNELSLNERVKSVAHSQAVFSNFLELADKVNSLKIAPVRIRMSLDLPNTSIGEDFYTLKDWLKSLKNEERQRYVGFLVQDPILSQNPYFSIGKNDVQGFGYAFNKNLGAISLSTNDVWNKDTYEIKSEFLSDTEEIIEETVQVKHILIASGKINHEIWLKEQFVIKQLQISKDIDNISDIWKNRETLFPTLNFCAEVENQLNSFESTNDSSFKKAIRYLLNLENHMKEVRNGTKEFDQFPGDISNDGEATLKKFSEERTFLKPNGVNEVFTLHCKLGNVRIYFTRNGENLIVGYIGRHLPTVKFEK